jgi:hypothetical protein
MQGIRKQPRHILRVQGRQYDLAHPSAGATQSGQPLRQQMRGTDLVVTVGPDQQQVAHVRMRNQMLDQIKGCRVQPLQIIEEQGERVVRASKHTEETPKYHLEPSLLILWWKVRGRWRLTDDESQFRDERDHELAIRAQRLI